MGENIYHARLMFARPFIDSLEFAKNGKELCGEISLIELPRLSEMLINSDGTLIYRVIGSHQGDSHALEIILRGNCNLRCQRCLEELQYSLDLSARLQLIKAEMLDEIEDAIEASKHLDVLELIEDEVLLTLPFAPRHPEGTCAAPIKDLRQTDNPFAFLAALKKQ
jgi:uncharacterized protein